MARVRDQRSGVRQDLEHSVELVGNSTAWLQVDVPAARILGQELQVPGGSGPGLLYLLCSTPKTTRRPGHMRIGEREAEGCDRPLILGTEREDGTVPFGTANKAQVPLGTE